MRGSGVSNIREWINLRYQKEKNTKNPEWVDLWNCASEVDMALAQQPRGQEEIGRASCRERV